MGATWEMIATQLYSALRMMPCRCVRVWDKSVECGYRVNDRCARCEAILTYEALKPESTNGG